jgi:hypothetical protein
MSSRSFVITSPWEMSYSFLQTSMVIRLVNVDVQLKRIPVYRTTVAIDRNAPNSSKFTPPKDAQMCRKYLGDRII